MTEEFDNSHTVTTMWPTKAGNGYKILVDGVWFYASKRQVLDLINGRRTACTFHTIKDEEQ